MLHVSSVYIYLNKTSAKLSKHQWCTAMFRALASWARLGGPSGLGQACSRAGYVLFGLTPAEMVGGKSSKLAHPSPNLLASRWPKKVKQTRAQNHCARTLQHDNVKDMDTFTVFAAHHKMQKTLSSSSAGKTCYIVDIIKY